MRCHSTSAVMIIITALLMNQISQSLTFKTFYSQSSRVVNQEQLYLLSIHSNRFSKRFLSHSELSLKTVTESDEDERMRKILEKVKNEDAEWLESVFGNSVDDLIPTLSSGNDNYKSYSNLKTREYVSSGVPNKMNYDFENSGENDNNNNDDDNNNNLLDNEKATIEELKVAKQLPNEIGDKDMSILFGLGYTPTDIMNIQPTVLKIIVDRLVQRPRKQLPRQWLRTDIYSKSSSSSSNILEGKNSGFGLNNRYNRDRKNDDYRSKNDNDENESQRIREKSRQWLGVDFREENGPSAGIGETFTWSGSGPSDKEKEVSGKVKKSLENTEFIEPQTGTEGPVSFWPGTDEFKNMLLDESEWRVNLIGTWSAPLIREETKWRYSVYKNWLKFLDEGLGDGFDVIPDSFDDNSKNNYVPERKNQPNNDLNAITNRRNSRTSNDVASSSKRLRTINEGQKENKREGNNKYDENRMQSVRNGISQSKADRYDDWIRQKMRDGDDWTDVNLEEGKLRTTTKTRGVNDWNTGIDRGNWFEEEEDENSSSKRGSNNNYSDKNRDYEQLQNKDSRYIDWEIERSSRRIDPTDINDEDSNEVELNISIEEQEKIYRKQWEDSKNRKPIFSPLPKEPSEPIKLRKKSNVIRDDDEF